MNEDVSSDPPEPEPVGWLCPECQNTGYVRLLGTDVPSAPSGSLPAEPGELHAVVYLTCGNGRCRPAEVPEGEEPF